jgi:hypothetical protein
LIDPEADCCSEADCGHEDVRELVISGVGAPAVVRQAMFTSVKGSQSSEHAFDPVLLAIEGLVV